MTDPVIVDIDIYRLQQKHYNDPAAAALDVCERLQLSGIPATCNEKTHEIGVTKGRLLHSLGPAYLSYKWEPDWKPLDFSGIALPEHKHLPWGTHV